MSSCSQCVLLQSDYSSVIQAYVINNLPWICGLDGANSLVVGFKFSLDIASEK